MTDKQWHDGSAKSISIFLNGQEISAPGKRGERITDDNFLLFFNAYYELLEYTIPPKLQQQQWSVVIDTKLPHFVTEDIVYTKDESIAVVARSLMVLRQID
jgi:glycogen operon protein